MVAALTEPQLIVVRGLHRVPTVTIAQAPAADELLSRDPLAVLIGMLLDQHMRQRSSDGDADQTVSIGAVSGGRGGGACSWGPGRAP